MRNMELIAGLPFNVKPLIDITDSLPSRPNDPNPMRSIEDITHISVHHSAVEGQGPQQYADYHVNKLKWYHIGYHTVIKVDQPYQVNDWLTFSYHTSSNNSYTVSVSISGDLSKRPLSEVERTTLYAVLMTYLSVFPNTAVERIWGHNEFPDNSTSCPCIDMNKVRDDMRTLQNKMKYQQTDGNKKATAFRIANQILYLYNLAQGKNSDGSAAGPGDVEWGINSIMDLKEFMDSKGIQY
jgi:hypothetical protein